MLLVVSMSPCMAAARFVMEKNASEEAINVFEAAGNPGCLLQIAAGLRARKMPMRAAHTIELLDWSYRGVTPQTTIS